ncbi:glycosyltransferase [Butyrivibrio sp. YAB3001]|uniref:glycosyltransferase n=1 Tax=Butyrivibrio sp. YAB3001 TaxID=1520812 RepID=UPI000B882743|nr:glycosyltransferase [Butyrivibrio sp. YAB3001]
MTGTNVVVCTSLMECLPTTAIEGFMHKCVVIVPDTAGISDYIENGKNGFIYKCNNKEALAESIKYVIDNREAMAEVKEEARKTYERFFQYDSLRKAFLKELSIKE